MIFGALAKFSEGGEVQAVLCNKSALEKRTNPGREGPVWRCRAEHVFVRGMAWMVVGSWREWLTPGDKGFYRLCQAVWPSPCGH